MKGESIFRRLPYGEWPKTCPKCEIPPTLLGRPWDIRYEVHEWPARTDEYLLVTCRECGYERYMDTADHPSLINEVIA